LRKNINARHRHGPACVCSWRRQARVGWPPGASLLEYLPDTAVPLRAPGAAAERICAAEADAHEVASLDGMLYEDVPRARGAPAAMCHLPPPGTPCRLPQSSSHSLTSVTQDRFDQRAFRRAPCCPCLCSGRTRLCRRWRWGPLRAAVRAASPRTRRACSMSRGPRLSGWPR